MITGFDNEIINDIFNFDKSYHLQDLHICVFPEKEFSYILIFYRKDYKRYCSFSREYKKLDESEQLRLIFYIIIKYTEDFFYSPKIQDILEKDKSILNSAFSTSKTFDDIPNAIKIKECIKKFNLKEYINIPNILGQAIQ